jgi:hypothetical protein
MIVEQILLRGSYYKLGLALATSGSRPQLSCPRKGYMWVPKHGVKKSMDMT